MAWVDVNPVHLFGGPSLHKNTIQYSNVAIRLGGATASVIDVIKNQSLGRRRRRVGRGRMARGRARGMGREPAKGRARGKDRATRGESREGDKNQR